MLYTPRIFNMGNLTQDLSSITALPGFVLINPYDETEQLTGTAGTFQIAEAVKDAESQRMGTVLSIGSEITTVYGAKLSCPIQIRVGSLVIYSQVAYDRFQYKGQPIKLIPFNDLRAIIKE